MKSFRRLSGLVSLALLPVTLAAAVPDLVVPEGVGVNIHFNRGHERDLDLIAEAGFKWVRMDLGWAGIERVKGSYDWSAYDELTANLVRRSLSAVYILDYSHPLYEETVTTKNPVSGEEHRDTASPQHPASVAAFARWAAAAADRFRGKPVIWEIWNEPNITFWKPKPDVAQYTALAEATCRAIRQADPDAVIVAPATSGIPLDFLEAFFRSGILAHLDAVSVHPYRNYQQSPETAADDYRKLRLLIEQYAPAAKKRMPILSGEWGYASHARGVSPETQAAFAARQQLSNLFHGIPLSIWYDWKNDGTDPAEREHNFGTVTHDLQPKPAYTAIRTLTRELRGFRLGRRLDVGNPADYVLEFRNAADEARLAAWTTGDAHEVMVPTAPGSQQPFESVRSNGEPLTLAGTGGELKLPLASQPLYVRWPARK